jgi:hypothetical protein
MQTITDHGYHKEKYDGEIFAGFLTLEQFEKGKFWKNQRLGNPIIREHSLTKFPWFIAECEIWDKGWSIDRFKK